MEEQLPKVVAQVLGAVILLAFVGSYAGRRLRRPAWRLRVARATRWLEVALVATTAVLAVWVLAVFPSDVGYALAIVGIILGFWFAILAILAAFGELSHRIRGERGDEGQPSPARRARTRRGLPAELPAR